MTLRKVHRDDGPCYWTQDQPDEDGVIGKNIADALNRGERPGAGPSAAPCGTCGGSGKVYTSSYGMPREWPCTACQGGER